MRISKFTSKPVPFMPIQFRCSNIVSYDASSEQYVRCNYLLTAPSDQFAKFIVCPQCNIRALVPPASEISSLPNQPTTPTKSDSQRRQPTAISVATSPAKSELKFSAFDSKSRCRKCGGAIGENFCCQVCGFKVILEASNTSLDRIEIQPAGCQRWFANKLAPGTGSASLVAAAHSLVALLLIILATTAIGLGGSSAGFVLAAIACFAGLYAYMIFEFRRIARRQPATLNWWQRAAWNLVLYFFRARRWRSNDASHTWQVLDLQNQPYDDAQITSLPEITKYHVIDLEGTRLTDAGLHRLQGLAGLQCLVVRNTNVTQNAVFLIQQRLPHTWIWN